MCILIIKEKGIMFPSEATIVNCMDANPDGFSMAYNVAGKVETFKTLDRDKFLDVYRRVTATADPRNTAVMLHMRIATHGSIKVDNCHCWKGEILGSKIAFAHNGILPITAHKDMTDSETFLRFYLEPCKSIGDLLSAVKLYIGTSKIAFIDGAGNAMSWGNFIDYRGVKYSNSSFRFGGSRYADPRRWPAMDI